MLAAGFRYGTKGEHPASSFLSNSCVYSDFRQDYVPVPAFYQAIAAIQPIDNTSQNLHRLHYCEIT